MRKAFEKLLERAIVHDIGESALQSGVGALILAGNGAEPEDIAAASAAGFGTAMIARPALRGGGALLGRQFEGKAGEMPQWYHRGMSFLPGSRQSVYGMDQALANPQTPQGLKQFFKSVKPVNDLRHKAYYSNDKGELLGMMEGDMSLIARMFGDNVAQAGIQLALPSIVGANSVETV